MPLLRRKSSTVSPSRLSTTPASTTTTPSSPTRPNEMQLKGVKRIVSGLKKRVSQIHLRPRRDSILSVSGDAQPFPAVLDVVPDVHHPITIPISPRSEHSLDTLTRPIVDGGLGKHYSDSEDSDSSSSAFSASSGHYRSFSADSSYHDAHSDAEDQVESPPSIPSPLAEERQRCLSSLSARLPPLESLTAPLEAVVFPSDKSEPERLPSPVERRSTVSFESLTAPLESLVLESLEVQPPLRVDEPVIALEPWQVPLPPLEPCEVPLPEEDEDLSPILPLSPTSTHSPKTCDVPLPNEDEDLLILLPAPINPPPSPHPNKAEDLSTLFSLSHSPTSIHMDPLGATVQGPSAGLSEGAMTSTLDSQLTASMEVAREAPLFSPPAPVGEPEVPNPFIEDRDPSEPDEETPSEDPMARSILEPAAEEIALAPPQSVTLPTPRSPNFNKSVPPTPLLPSDDEDEDEAPELYLPGLTLPTMFLPIPNTDPLSTLLTKYIPPEKRPPRDLTGDYARVGGEMHTLVMTNSWRAIARQARDRIVEADPEDVPFILSLWYLRLSSLARMRLFNQTSAECTNLFTVLHAVEPPETRAFLFDRVLPFELEVLQAKLKYWAGDHMGYLDALAALLHRCKSKARSAKTDPAAAAMWRERGARVCLIIASQLIEMKDFPAAASLLEPLCQQPGNVTSPALRSAVARVYLQGGHVSAAAKHFAAVAEDPTTDPIQKATNAALFASAEGDWARATAELRRILESDPENFVAVNNLAVALLNQGKLKEAIEVLEAALRASPATIVTAEPFLFNLSTLYELRSAAGVDKKRELLIEVAKWAGDGLRTTCLKMPTN